MRQIYRKNITEALEALSNYEFQKIAWFENHQGLCYSLYENMMDLFYNSTLHDVLESGETVFDNVADEALRHLEGMVVQVNERDYSAAALLDSPQMQAIRQKAAQALFLVQTSTGKDSTVEMIE